MPFNPGISKYLTDEQYWTIVGADRSVTNVHLGGERGGSARQN